MNRFATLAQWNADGTVYPEGDLLVVTTSTTSGSFAFKVSDGKRPFLYLSYGGTAYFTLPGASSDGLTDEQLRASPVVVDTQLTQPTTPADTQPVSFSGSVPVTGALTDAELRATPVPVSGTVTATGPLTDVQLRATPVPVSGTVSTGGLTDAELRASPVDVDTGLVQPTTPADTQPVSGPLTDAQLRAVPVPVSGTVSTGGLTDAELRASPVPVSAASLPLPTGAATEATVNTLLKPGDTLTGVTTVTSITNPVGATQSGTWTVQPGNTANTTAWKVDGSAVTQPVSGTVSVSSITPPTLTKGTQGATGFSVQDLKDAGRTTINLYTDGSAAAGTTTTETALTLTLSSGTAATSTGVSFTPTNGKTFRITNMTFETRGNTTGTAQTTRWNLRINTAGAVITSSTPIIFTARTSNGATANQVDRQVFTFPEGLDIFGDGTLQWGITTNSAYITNAPTLWCNIVGYEF